MSVRIMRLPEVVEITGRSATSIWRDEKAGRFPRRRKLGANTVGWRSDEVEAWIDGLPVVGEGDEGAEESEPAA